MRALSPRDWSTLMRQAIELAGQGPRSANPQVGCVIVDEQGQVIGSGYHHGAGTAHAEVEALAQAGAAARGATAVVSMEPCRHTGRTGPCTSALIEAGIARVVFAQEDPTAEGGGGAEVLRAAGIEVIASVERERAQELNRLWTHVQRTGRPWVLLKLAQTLDAKVGAAGTAPIAVSGDQARAVTHELRAGVDAVVVGTGTALADDPQLTVRERRADRQPLRVVMGQRQLPAGLRLLDGSHPTLLVREPDPRSALALLREQGVQSLLLEGGPTLATAFLEAGCVDEVVWFLAPTLLGSGIASTQALPRAIPVDVTEVRLIGDDVMVRGRIAPRH